MEHGLNGSSLSFIYRVCARACDTCAVMTGELQDLRIMNSSADRQLTELRNELRSGKTSAEKEAARLDTEVGLQIIIVRCLRPRQTTMVMMMTMSERHRHCILNKVSMVAI